MNMWKMRELMDKATNVVMNYTETEAKVREATNDDAWGPTGAMMQELAQATFTYEQFPDVMSMLWKRMLQENKRNWRRTYKALLLLNYLVRNGSERVVTSSREHIFDLRSLENYSYVDETGKDQGINVRHKVRELIDFIQDDDKLRDERKKAKKNKDKYIGMSNEAMGMNFGAGDRWSDNPKWTKPKIDSYNDWDKDIGKNKDNNYDEHNNSDDGEREDSDNDQQHQPHQQQHHHHQQQSPNKFSEKDKSIDKFDKVKKIITTNNNLHINKINRQIKKVDLGAAANFGKEQQQLSNKNTDLIKTKNKNDILNDLFDNKNNDNNNTRSIIDNDDDDDFNPRDNDYTPVVNKINNNFGDFTNAFSGVNNKNDKNDEFADFTTAFDSNLTIGNDNWGTTTTNLQKNTLNNSVNSNVGGGSLGTDLLADFDGFTSFSSNTSSNNVNAFNSNNMMMNQNANLTIDTNLLSPMSVNNSHTIGSSNNNILTTQVGSTWAGAGLNIDLDNLLGNKSKQTGAVLSMNQLASNSPTHQAPRSFVPTTTMGLGSPRAPTTQQSTNFFPKFP
ncbi:hypothetical protein HCN44_008766 [Aphidius gifuensis]|uniref:ENTH domain-containing protein n=1 Tax=Aphidius gifuensis TaxID=684658 RepID=A0A835CP40_APHGI|nr:clathrin interactor 1 isoform X2 [Aphidius gifuensis]KAF7991454.1 hypothetical protein HCN44_008766 [Aphidius gifuensis]